MRGHLCFLKSGSGTEVFINILHRKNVELECELGSFLRIESTSLERTQTVGAVHGSTCSQKDGVEAKIACGLPEVGFDKARSAVDWLFQVAPGPSIFAIIAPQEGCAAGWE